MPASFFVYLRPVAPSPLRGLVGRWLNGLLYHLVSEADPQLSARMHDDAETPRKPFTVSALEGRFREQGGRRYAVPEEEYRVRFTMLTEAIQEALVQVLIRSNPGRRALTLGNDQWQLVRFGIAPRERDVWLGATSYVALARAPRPDPWLTFHFASPTAFKADKLHILFPEPRNVFRHLREKWEAFSIAPLPEPEALTAFVERHVEVSRYRLETGVLYADAYKLIGFVGHCTYHVREHDPTYLAALNTLADFALYAGVGMKTTQGMGQARRVERA